MVDDTQNVNGFFLKDIIRERKTTTPLIFQALFVCIFFAVSFLCYTIPQKYVHKIIHDHYESKTHQITNEISARFNNLKYTFEHLKHLTEARKVTYIPATYDVFDLFFHFRIDEENNERAINVSHINTDILTLKSIENALKVGLNKNTTHELINKRAFQDGRSIFVSKIEGLDILNKPHTGFIIQAVNAADINLGFMVGYINFERLFKKEWFATLENIDTFKIRNLSTGEMLFDFKALFNDTVHKPYVEQSFDFELGQQKIGVQFALAHDKKLFFLTYVPFLFALFGSITAGILVFHFNKSIEQKAKRRVINAALDQKEEELSVEMTRREQLIHALEKAEKDNLAIINAVSDIIFEIDIDGRIVFLNNQWRKITGFDIEKSKGQDLFAFIKPEDQEETRSEFRLLYAGTQNILRKRTRLRLANNSYRAVELSLSRFEEENDKTQKRVIGTFTDIEDRRRAERALGEAEKKYRAIVENAAGGIFQLTPTGMYLSVNRAMARILGYDRPEEILRSIKNAHKKIYVNTREREKFIREIETRGSITNFETQVYRKDGSIIWVNENVRVVRDENGRTLYYEGSMEDITQRKKSDLSLREAKMKSDMASRAKSEFLANMSHELRTPLNSIIGFSEIIKTEALGPVAPPSYLEYANDIHSSGTRLLQIINEILDISKIEAGERALNESVVDIESVVDACIALTNARDEETNLTITNNLKDTPKIIAEEVAIKQIVLNLLSNAVKFTPTGGRITISGETDNEGQLQISISDTGIGLDETEIQKALSPFGQIQSELSRSNSGTGLGLTLVDALVKLHGGQLEIFSQKGIGTTITIVFPSNRLAT